jgi:asparagine synthase (glutamine-hydrolysing)
MGFGVPIDTWLRGPLRDWAQDMLSPFRLENEGFFQVEPVRQMLDAHLSERYNYQHQLWNILMFQAWIEKQ